MSANLYLPVSYPSIQNLALNLKNSPFDGDLEIRRFSLHLSYKYNTNTMRGAHLGEFEELVLLTAAVLDGNAYTVTIVEEIVESSGRKLTLSSVHTVLARLEKKGYLHSYMGGSTGERGGRRRRLYRITASGYQSLQEARDVRSKMWELMPKLSFDF